MLSLGEMEEAKVRVVELLQHPFGVNGLVVLLEVVHNSAWQKNQRFVALDVYQICKAIKYSTKSSSVAAFTSSSESEGIFVLNREVCYTNREYADYFIFFTKEWIKKIDKHKNMKSHGVKEEAGHEHNNPTNQLQIFEDSWILEEAELVAPRDAEVGVGFPMEINEYYIDFENSPSWGAAARL
jgi:hypothetical protein